MNLKKLLPALLAAALAVCLCAGCDQFVPIMPGTELNDATVTAAPDGSAAVTDAFPDRPLYEFMGWDRLRDTYYENTPVALSMRRCDSDGTPGFASPIFDRASIIAACDALRAMTITDPGQTGGAVSEIYTLTMADGTEYSLHFAGSDLVTSSGSYTVTGGDALRQIAFPAYNGTQDVFDLYQNESIRAFADNFYSSTVKSVSRRQNQGATFTSRDQAVIQQAFSLLAGATVSAVEMNPDQNIDLNQTTDYVFTMDDDSYYTFTFTGPCLTVTVSQAFGPVYYWLSGIDELSAMTILPESTAAVFTGGYVADLREDIRAAADAANGASALTVSGVYVDYTIGGTRGYLTLDSAVGAGFLQQVAAIPATADMVESPSGDIVTVSVTLSDGSGPIIYFTGDTVQQMMGSNYACDGGAMVNLRSRILELAQDERNIGQITSGSTD